jgi:hypothetical protein
MVLGDARAGSTAWRPIAVAVVADGPLASQAKTARCC